MPTVSIEGNERKFEVKEQDILLDALEKQGVDLPHGCLAGSCGACRIEIIEGADNLEPPSDLEQDTVSAIRVNYERKHGADSAKGKTFRLSCRAKVKGDIKFRTL